MVPEGPSGGQVASVEWLGRTSGKDARHIGQVTSRIYAARFYARTPFLAMHRVREIYGTTINPRSFQDDLWRPHAVDLVARAEVHTWTPEGFKNIKRSLHSLGDDSAALQWEKIERHGEQAVRRALDG